MDLKKRGEINACVQAVIFHWQLLEIVIKELKARAEIAAGGVGWGGGIAAPDLGGCQVDLEARSPCDFLHLPSSTPDPSGWAI